MEKEIRILVVDDQPVVREGLQHLLGQEEDMEVVGQSANGEEALRQVETLAPSIVLLEVKMPAMDGIELTRRLKEKYPSCHVIVLTVYDEYLTQAMQAGALGYLLKDIKREELAQAIRRVHRGEVVISESIPSKLRNAYEDYGKKAEEGSCFEEVQLVIPPPVVANQFMRFVSQVEETLQCRVLQVVGSWHEGTAVTFSLNQAIPLADILNKLAEMPEIEIVEKPRDTLPSLLKKAAAIPRLKLRPRTTIYFQKVTQ